MQSPWALQSNRLLHASGYLYLLPLTWKIKVYIHYEYNMKLDIGENSLNDVELNLGSKLLATFSLTQCH
jgi:hypothetical protein